MIFVNNFGHVGIVVRDIRVVVVVGNVRDIRDVRIRHVHVLKVITTHVIGRHVRLAVSEREPTDATTGAERQANAPMIAANPSN